ncbi:type III restriction enzyme, res subunit [Chryseotalea sanaruensis]|uniref:DNA helicase n=2 Tax=Chryseotalea sanaruensis TaxID=2482724 RepID=A0A401U9B4_9BACT|nr:type III restriction enzyme, res subunit [Chryseotalea sanaruensis]
MLYFMAALDDLKKTFELIKQERQADLQQYQQKVLQKSITQKKKDGVCWYPVKLDKTYIGTGERLIIEVQRTNNFEQRHSFQSGKAVSVFSNATNTPQKDHVSGVINFVRDNNMVITLNVDELPDWIEDGSLGVDVMFDEISYREMEFALKTVMKAEEGRIVELRDILLGYQKATFINIALENSSTTSAVARLNASQQKALEKVLSANDVGIIHGPPGTGKTTTLVQGIIQTVAEEKQVLVCAPSNAAIDLLVEKLSEQGLNVLRIGHPARVTEQTLSKTLDSRIANHEYYKDLRGMRRKMEELKTLAFKFKRKFGYEEREQRKLLLNEVKALKADADVLEFYITNNLIEKSDVIACTLVGSSHYVLRGKKFKSVFIDEAAQSLEPACWIPLLKAQRIIFAGDHQQLPPTIKSFEAAKAGLAETLMEKCIRHQPDTASMLQIQYRMHEAIMRFSSDYFYKGELIADESVKHHLLKDEEAPVLFIDTAGCGYNEEQDMETLSRFNKEEAELLMRSVERLIREMGEERWLEEKITLGIIAPYSAQVEYLTKLAEQSEELSNLKHLVSINTVDAFQGQERDVIAIGFVRSNDKGEVGFLSDIRRTNVALTRARKKLLVVGDSATLGAHPFYLQWLEYVQKNDFYKSAFELEY